MIKYKYVVLGHLLARYGNAVNFCVKYNISLNKIEPMSHDKEIENVCGKRGKGWNFIFPFEMDYFCPICGNPPDWKLLDTNETELLHLHFSEYNYYMWCERCNIDIPSFLCLRPDNKKSIEIYSYRFLEMIKDIKKNFQSETNKQLKTAKILFLKDLLKSKQKRKKIKKALWILEND